MSGKTFKIVNGDMSDGYHTFDELYDHRIRLYLALIVSVNCPRFYKPDHYKGWDAVYMELPTGQISYHVPVKHRKLIARHCKELTEKDGDIYDGHNSAHVIERLNIFAITKN
jgi:hypothetical protein